jgi:8-oxo-dGTP pyrophosphatase MutT (NUDIX family)
MYKVFFNDRVILICSVVNNSRLDNSLFYPVTSALEAENAWKSFLGDTEKRDMCLLVEHPDEDKKFLFGLFTIVNAAGGVVSNSCDQLLCILRWGKWDLPKGKMEKNEKPEETALREVEEECGISGLAITGFNSITYHIYEHPRKPGRWVLKQTYWFNMVYSGNEMLIPQTLEDIVEAKWFNRSDLNEVTYNTWVSLLSIFDNYISSG